MSKIYEDANEQHVRAVVIYKKSASDSKAYVDSGYTTQFTTSELKNAFLKGAVIALPSDGGFVKPVKYAEASSVGSVYYITPNTSTATSADIASLAAKADS